MNIAFDPQCCLCIDWIIGIYSNDSESTLLFWKQSLDSGGRDTDTSLEVGLIDSHLFKKEGGFRILGAICISWSCVGAKQNSLRSVREVFQNGY